MKSFGNLNLQQNLLKAAVIESSEALPNANVAKGRLVFHDGTLYICVSIIGAPLWVPLTNKASTYSHRQEEASKAWLIDHDLGSEAVVTFVYNENNEMIIADSIKIVNSNQVLIDFNDEIVGSAVIVSSAAISSGFRAVPCFNYTQTTPSEVWTINHRLGFDPLVQIFIDDKFFIPAYVKHVSDSIVEVGFTEPTSGTARCI